MKAKQTNFGTSSRETTTLETTKISGQARVKENESEPNQERWLQPLGAPKEKRTTLQMGRTLIWSGIPFEKAVVQITHAGQNQNFGHVKSVSDPSPYRVDPKCKRCVDVVDVH